MVPRHKLNDVLETETQRVSVSTAIGVWKRFCFRFQKKKVSVVQSMKKETCFLETRFRFQKKKVSVWTEAGNRNALRFRFKR